MAVIKKVVRSNPLSTFSAVADRGNADVWEAIADTIDDVYRERVEPAALAEMERRGTEEGIRAAETNSPVVKTSYPSAPSQTVTGHDHSVHAGQTHTKWLKYSNQNATRNKPLSDKLVSSMSFLPELGVTMEVISGGQDGKGEGNRRTGSTRHDHGDAADADFYKEGRKLDWNNPDDVPLFQEIVKRARANGVTGIGAGDDYMGAGRMHIGFGPEAVWGAGGKGANAPGWLREAAAHPLGMGGHSHGPAVTTVTASDGAIQPKQYSPFSGKLLQAHDAAAKVAYGGQILTQGQTDILDLSRQYEMNPEGFGQAAQEYIDQIVANAPDVLKTEIRSDLNQIAQRRTAGIMADKQADTRKRANNSNQAMIERYSSEYAELKAAGDEEGASIAFDRLSSQLRLRESLPGLAFTQAQSANVIRAAEKSAARIKAQAQKAQIAEVKGELKEVLKAAKAGLHAESEGLLSDPNVVAMHPELAREAKAYVTLRDEMPGLKALPPDQLDGIVANSAQGAISEEWEIDVIKAAQKIAKDSRKAWATDPIAHASEVLENKPPQIPEYIPGAEDQFIDVLSERRKYGNALYANGRVEKPRFFSDEERQRLALVLGKDSPPEVRAAVSEMLVGGFMAVDGEEDPVTGRSKTAYEDVFRVFDELKVDGITRHGAKMAAVGGIDVTAEALRGQSMLDENLVETPTSAKQNEYLNEVLGEALGSVAGNIKVHSSIKTFTSALYAANAGEMDPESAEAKALYKDSIQRALGQSENGRGDLVGGIQAVFGNKLVLPPTVNGEEAQKALTMALGFVPDLRGKTALERMAMMGGALLGEQGGNLIEDAWLAASDGRGVPLAGDQPISRDYFKQEEIRIVSFDGRYYRIEYGPEGAAQDASDENGNIYLFELDKLVGAMQ